jgi:hypothetical protein
VSSSVIKEGGCKIYFSKGCRNVASHVLFMNNSLQSWPSRCGQSKE